MLFKPKANQQRLRPKRRKCGRDWCKETMDTRRIEQIKTTGHEQKHINTHTLTYSTHRPQCHHKRTQSPESTSKPEAGRKSSPRQNTTDRLLAFVAPLLQRNTPLIPSKKPKSWTLGTPLPHIQSPAPGLAWPEFLHWCPPACRAPTDAKWWWLIDGERTDTWQRPRSRVEMGEWKMGVSRGRLWRCRQRGQRKRKERGESRDRGGGGEEKEREGRINKGRCCFFVSLPCLWRTYVSWCWRPGWYWWT